MNWPDSPTLLAPLGPWFLLHRRAMPWRDGNLDRPHPDPYAVLVSELMLQQTQVATVIPYFERWMVAFPDASSLARASENEIHKLWEGLGYYRRARHLQASASHIAAHGWPTDFEGLLKLPGLGPYTAAAVASIAFQWPQPALDGNTFRVLARLVGLESDPKLHAKRLRVWLRPALEKHGPSRMTQGLMELGATVCVPTPKCGGCPLADECAARRCGATDRIPRMAQRPKPKAHELWLMAVEAEGHWLLRTPSQKGLLAGLWKWPTVEVAILAEGGMAADPSLPYTSMELRAWPGWTQVYTHRREVVNPLWLRLANRFATPKECLWVPTDEVEGLALGKRDQRLRELIKEPGTVPVEGSLANRLLARVRHGAAQVG